MADRPPKSPRSRCCCARRAAFAPAWCAPSNSVERALELYGPPVYVRHEIVHNRYVVESLRAKGAIFVEELDEIPDTGAPVIFSAHGVPRAVPEEAARRNLFALDATCPLVTKVHREAEIHHRRGREIVLIGHAGHPEVIGTMGQLPAGAVSLIETLADAASFHAARRRQARLCDADHAVGRRHRRDRRAAQSALSGDRRAAQGRHLLRHHQPAGSGQARRADGRRHDRGRRAEFVEFAAAARKWPSAPAVRTPRWCSAPPISTGAQFGAHRARSASPPAPRRRKCWSRRSSTPSPQRYAVSVETVSAAEEGVFFPLPRPLRENEAAE